jgi:Chaperone of endosialidase
MKKISTFLSGCLFFIHVIAQPPNDNPCGALSIPLNESADPCNPATYNITGATYLNLAIPTGCNASNPDVWYTFSSSKSNVSIKMGCGIFYQIYTALPCNGAFTLIKDCVVCSDGFGELFYNITPGNTYYLRISHNIPGGDFSFSLCINTNQVPDNQRIGINTLLPLENLDVAGTARFRNTVKFNGNISLSLNAANNRVLSSDPAGNASWRDLSSIPGLWAGSSNNIYSTNTGNTGIGTNTPVQKLEVVGAASGNPITMVIANRGGFGPAALEFVSDYGIGSQWRPGYIRSNDVGLFTGTLEFYTNGSGTNSLYGSLKGLEVRNGQALTATGSVGSYSDSRLKNNITQFNDGLNVVNKLNPVKFFYNKDAPFKTERLQVGIIAQELEKIAPYMVEKSEQGSYNDLRSVNNQAFIFLLINAVKEQEQKIEKQQKEIDELRKMVKALADLK